MALNNYSKYVEKIATSAGQMDRLITDLLSVASMEAGNFQISTHQIEARTMISDAVEGMRQAAEKKFIRINPHVLDKKCVLMVDRERILQVFGNLIANAIKFSPEKGTIEIGYEIEDDRVRFKVSDHGIGIAADKAAHIFERYWTDDAERVGTGLGLAIAKGIVEAHGGEIGVTSKLGEGSTFYFTVPRADSQPHFQESDRNNNLNQPESASDAAEK